MEFSWFFYSLLSALLIGLSVVFYKLPSFKNYSPFLSTFYTNVLLTIFAIIFLFAFSDGETITPSIFGIVWGLLFAATMILQKITLKEIETNALFPITTSISNVATILIGFLFLAEKLSSIQIIGVVLILWSIYLFSRKKEDFPLTSEVLWLAAGIVAVSTLSKYVQKMGAVNEPLFNLMIWQFLAAGFAAFVSAFIFEKNTLQELHSVKKYIPGAFLIGVPMFLGSWAILRALSLAPLSLVYAIHPTYALVTAVAGVIIFKEKLTTRKLLLIFLIIIGVILVRIG